MKIPGGWLALRRSFAIRDYRLFTIGNLTSNVGLWAQRVALGWLTWELTHSTAWLGGIAVAESLPTFVLGLIAGTVVDRANYLKLLRTTQALSLVYSLVMTALVLAGWMNIWLLLFLVLIRGSLGAFNRPSRMTVIFALVGRDLLTTAVTVNSIVFNVSRFIGPAVGGWIIVAAGIGWAYAAAAAMFAVFTLVLAMIKTEFAEPPARAASTLTADAVAGLRYMVTHPGIGVMMGVLVVVAFLVKPLTDLLPGFVGQVFARGPDGLAALMSAHGAGAMAAAAYLASRGRGIQGLTRVNLCGIALASVAALAFAVVSAFWMALVLVAVIGFAFILQNVSNQTLLQAAADPSLRGRVISNYGLVNQGVPAIGALVIGGIAEHTGLNAPVAVGAALCIVAWAWAWRLRHRLADNLEVEKEHHRATVPSGRKREVPS
jgi:MFS family permease